MAICKITLNGQTQMDATPATATAMDILTPKTAMLANGEITIGTGSGGGGGAYAWFGPGTELVQTGSKTYNLANDTTYSSWTPSTSSGTILAEPSTYDFSYTYNYKTHVLWAVVQEITSISPKQTATLKLLPIKWGRFCIYYISGMPNNYSQYQSGEIGTTIAGSYTNMLLYYYNSSSTLKATTASYGPMYTSSTPTATGSTSGDSYTLTIKRRDIYARCNNSYFATSRYSDIDAENTNLTITCTFYTTPNDGAFAYKEYDKFRLALNA